MNNAVDERGFNAGLRSQGTLMAGTAAAAAETRHAAGVAMRAAEGAEECGSASAGIVS